MATQDQINDITALYVGYFDRAPDPAGLQFWIDQLNGGREFNTIAEDFASSPEATALYPYLVTPGVSTPAAFISSVYMNMFNRAPDAAGLAFWTGVLNDGSVSVADMIEAIINGAQDGSVDKATLDNKVAVGFDFATKTANIPGFEFDAAAKAAAVAVLDGVTDDAASVDAAIAETDAFVAAGVGGDTFTLTAGTDFADVDGASRNGPFAPLLSDFRFTDANETVNATHLTLTGVDSLSDSSSSDNDVLNIAVSGVLAGTPAVAGIENINVTLSAAGWGELDMTNYSGVQKVAMSGQVNSGDYVGAYNFADSGVTLFDTSAVTSDVGDWTEIADGNADQNITVIGGAGQTYVELGDGNNTISTGAGADYVEVGIGNNTIDVGDGINEVYVFGDGDTNTVDGNNTITSGSGVDLVAIFGDGNNTISTGAGGDFVGIYGAGNNTIDTGAGNDSVYIDGAGNNIVNTGDGADSITVDAGAGSGANVITAGAGADLIDVTAGGANELVFLAGDTGLTDSSIDVVTGFVSGTDSLNFGVAGTNLNYGEFGVAVDYADALNMANLAFTSAAGTLSYAFVDDGADGWMFYDADFSGEADMSVALVGVTAGGIEYQDMVA